MFRDFSKYLDEVLPPFPTDGNGNNTANAVSTAQTVQQSVTLDLNSSTADQGLFSAVSRAMAGLANWVYDNKEFGDWKLAPDSFAPDGTEIPRQIKLDNGFEATIYTKKINGVDKYALSIAGTNEIKDVSAGVDLINGKVPAQYDELVKFIKELKEQGVTLDYVTGHSLGGGLTQLLSRDVELSKTLSSTQFFTTNAVGTANIQDPRLLSPTKVENKVFNFGNSEDAVFMHANHVGKIYTTTTGIGDYVHGSAQFVDATRTYTLDTSFESKTTVSKYPDSATNTTLVTIAAQKIMSTPFDILRQLFGYQTPAKSFYESGQDQTDPLAVSAANLTSSLVWLGHGKETLTLQKLSTLDTNRNGVLDSTDREFANLRLWSDMNEDGVANAMELKTLQESGVSYFTVSNNPTLSASSKGDMYAQYNGLNVVRPIAGLYTAVFIDPN